MIGGRAHEPMKQTMDMSRLTMGCKEHDHCGMRAGLSCSLDHFISLAMTIDVMMTMVRETQEVIHRAPIETLILRSPPRSQGLVILSVWVLELGEHFYKLYKKCCVLA